LSKSSDFLAIPTLVVLSNSKWQKQKWVASLPKSLEARVKVAANRLKTPLEAGAGYVFPGRLHAKKIFGSRFFQSLKRKVTSIFPSRIRARLLEADTATDDSFFPTRFDR